MPAKCFNCQKTGHVADDCPNTPAGVSRPWCRSCHPQTRLIEIDENTVRRCRCHPLADQRLAQYRVCGACGQVIYEWDQSDCTVHQLVNQHREHVALAPTRTVPSLVHEPAELSGMPVAGLADALADNQTFTPDRTARTPDQEAALRALARQQVADSRSRRR